MSAPPLSCAAVLPFEVAESSGRWIKAKRKMARYHRYGADVRGDVTHKTSRTLAVDPRYQLFVFGALEIKNMTQKDKPKPDERSCRIRHGASASCAG